TRDDGVQFDVASLETVAIRTRSRHDGARARFTARVGSARIAMQLDVGFGDVVTPGPVEIEYPALLDFEAPTLRAYTPVTTIAEKVEAMVVLGVATSRMKDYYDVWQLVSAH